MIMQPQRQPLSVGTSFIGSQAAMIVIKRHFLERITGYRTTGRKKEKKTGRNDKKNSKACADVAAHPRVCDCNAIPGMLVTPGMLVDIFAGTKFCEFFQIAKIRKILPANNGNNKVE